MKDGFDYSSVIAAEQQITRDVPADSDGKKEDGLVKKMQIQTRIRFTDDIIAPSTSHIPMLHCTSSVCVLSV